METENEAVRKRLAPFIVTGQCPECKGMRLIQEAREVTINGINIAQLTSKTIGEAFEWVKKQQSRDDLNKLEQAVSEPLLNEVGERLKFLLAVGLDYLTLDRTSGTLAGGEAQRIQLASQIGTGLTGIIYVLDEPTIGLHQRDNARLIKTLKRLRDLDNTVIVVEHDRETINSADWVIDMGPRGGTGGGEIVAQGTPKVLSHNKASLTGKYLLGKKKIRIKKSAVKSTASIELYGASEHNLKSVDVEFPLGKFICVTGVSGSGKSTLIHDTLYHALSRRFSRVHHELPGKFDHLYVPDRVKRVSLINQNPIGRTSRSNPATYSGVFDYIRKIFTATREARVRGYGPGRFSFNVRGGRCEHCEGQGQIRVVMQFLPDIYVKCDVCHGSRYNRETLEVTYRNRSIADVLKMSVDRSMEFFKNIHVLRNKLEMLNRVGLGYMELGQPAPFLSGGEAQRLKISRELGKIRSGHTIYLLDEPTRGLHFEDLNKLLRVIDDLVKMDNTVIVIEHNLDIIKNADWLIDLGPEGGERGGELVAAGTVEEIAKYENSYTGKYLLGLQ